MRFEIRFGAGSVTAETLSGNALNGGQPMGQYVYYAYSRLNQLRVAPGKYSTGRRRRVAGIAGLWGFACPEVYRVDISILGSLELDAGSSSWPAGEEQIQVYRGDMALVWSRLPWWASLSGGLVMFGARGGMKAAVRGAELTLRYSPLEDQDIDGQIAEFELDPQLPNAAASMEGALRGRQPLVTGDPAQIQRVQYPVTSLTLKGELQT